MKKTTKIAAVMAAAVIIVIIAAVILIKGLKSSGQKKALETSWYRTDTDEEVKYIYFLNISEDKAEYIFSSKWITETVAEFDYEVLSDSEIRFTSDTVDKTLNYELINDNSSLVFTPALTSNKDSEVWHLYIEDETGEE